jgi:hypothetical protein
MAHFLPFVERLNIKMGDVQNKTHCAIILLLFIILEMRTLLPCAWWIIVIIA